MTEMERLVAVRGIEPWRRRLFLPAYRVKDAAKFAEVNPRTVNYWCFGGGQSGPALPHRERGAAISWCLADWPTVIKSCATRFRP